MGTVWRTQDELLDRQVALKQLHVSPYLDEDELATLHERTRREARAAARINHPNVVVVHDVVDDRGLPCIVMEYVPSRTLGDVLQDGTITPEEAARIGRGMIAALRAAHAAGVLHRDVKPGNVLLGADGRVVLTDFGIAQSSGTSTLTKTGEMVGSIDYIAPERVKGGKPGPASDLWALGATLYQALEGRPPFRKDTAVETAYAIAMDPLEPPRRAGALTRLVETLLAKEPDLRPPAELAEQILREPAAEAETALMPVGTAGAGPGSGGSRAETAVTEPPVAEPAVEPVTVPEPVPVAGADDRKDDGDHKGHSGSLRGGDRKDGGDRKGDSGRGERRPKRAALWGVAVVAVVAVAGLAVGTALYLRDGGPEDTTARDAPAKDASKDAAKPDASAAPAGPSASAEPPPPVPKGYHLVKEEKLGVSFPVPDGWTRRAKSAVEVDYIDRTGLVNLKVNVLDFASPDHLQHWKEVESQMRTKVDGYQRGRMQETTYRGEPAAVWEFEFKGRARDFRAIDLGFGREGGNEYAIYLSGPKADWERHRPVFDAVRDGFRRER
ncbi:serine/threonine protein kinase [Streptomyces albireticuli]|uniref:non-specific serine/threonine protein kinase n=2 Tax=Streptomyces albireticuli TaxID=1940 RepID=A0A2A2D3K1_9ACTN|nr:serine/threonine protein kinase [Streptomyces albireticuli]MCD9162819.1 serine/threonine protein kinase [Streptomyces albireticuli]MCD9192379.1 serine/threonine protein kinase [Streptomyces albireticuli]PAU45910.1 serine/threonine protein kinase [Streptomyces albireticuli]